MIALKFVSLTLTGVSQEIIIGILLFVIFNLPIEWKKVFQYALAMGLTSSISNTVLPRTASTASMVIFVVAMISVLIYIFKFSILKSIAAMCLVYFLKAMVSLTTLPIYKLVFGEKFIVLNPTLLQQVVAQIVGIIFLFLIVAIIMSFKLKIYIPEDLNKKRTLSIIINLVFSLLLLFPNLFYIQDTTDSRSIPLLIYNTASFVLIVALNVFNFAKLGEMELLKQNIEFQSLYIKTLNEMIDSLRGIKHDHNNMLQVVGGYISVNDMDGLQKFHSQMISESKKLNNIIPLNSYVKDNPALYGLLLAEISSAEIKNVNFTLSVLCKIKLNNIKIYDFCKVLGILLDNAIEAASESNKKFVELSIRESADKNRLFIEIINSCVENVNIEAIFKDGYTTKKGHSGFGLWETQKIINKYKNCKLHTNVKQNVFSQRIEITYL